MNMLTTPLTIKEQGQAAQPHNLALYFVGAYAITWLCWGLVALAARQLVTLPIPQAVLMLIGGFGPLLMALGLSAYEGGHARQYRLSSSSRGVATAVSALETLNAPCIV